MWPLHYPQGLFSKGTDPIQKGPLSLWPDQVHTSHWVWDVNMRMEAEVVGADKNLQCIEVGEKGNINTEVITTVSIRVF